MAFSVAAPVGAILSYLVLSVISSLGQNASSESWIGPVLLFSVSNALCLFPVP